MGRILLVQSELLTTCCVSSPWLRMGALHMLVELLRNIKVKILWRC